MNWSAFLKDTIVEEKERVQAHNELLKQQEGIRGVGMFQEMPSIGSSHWGVVADKNEFSYTVALDEWSLHTKIYSMEENIPVLGEKVLAKITGHNKRLGCVYASFEGNKGSDIQEGRHYDEVMDTFCNRYSMHLGTAKRIESYGVFVDLKTVPYTVLCPIPKHKSRVPKEKDEVIVRMGRVDLARKRINGNIMSIDGRYLNKNGVPFHVRVRF